MKKTVINAVIILSVFSVIDRALGFFFKIYLARELSAAEMGIYQVALSMFFVLLMLTTSGIPLVVSKLTAKYSALGYAKKERAVTSAALILGSIVSIIVTAAVFILRTPFSGIFADIKSTEILLILLPALFFSSVCSALRGNMWGHEKYITVSLIEILEQISRIILCVILFLAGVNKLEATALSLTAGVAAGSVICVIFFIKNKGGLHNPKGHILPLLRSSAPITLSRAAGSVINSVIAVAVPFLLISSGKTSEEALALFGSGIGMAMPLLYIPITIVGSLAMVMVPAVSANIGKGDFGAVRAQVEKSVAFSVIVSALFVPAFTALGEQIGLFVYDNSDAGLFLSAAGWLLIPLSVENITSSVMNSLDLEIKSFFHSLIGSALMFGLMFAFYGRFDINLLPLGMGLSWTLASALNLVEIKKKTGMCFTFVKKLAIASAIIIPDIFVTSCFFSLLRSLPLVLSLCICGIISLIFFTALAFVTGLIDAEFFKVNASKTKKCTTKKEKNTHRSQIRCQKE